MRPQGACRLGQKATASPKRLLSIVCYSCFAIALITTLFIVAQEIILEADDMDRATMLLLSARLALEHRRQYASGESDC